MSDLTVSVAGAVVSGVFSIAAAAVPHYLQRAKSPTALLEEIKAGRPLFARWHILFGIAFPMLSYFLAELLVMVIFLVGYLAALYSIPESQRSILDASATLRSPLYETISSIELAVQTVVMFGSIVYTARFLGHRFATRALRWVIASIVCHTFVEAVIFYIQPAKIPGIIVAEIVVADLLIYTVAPYIGLRWASRTRDRFVLSLLFDRLPRREKKALLELARGVVEDTPSESDDDDSQSAQAAIAY